MVDAAAEIRKLEKQLGQVETRAISLQKQMAIHGYEEKVGLWTCVNFISPPACQPLIATENRIIYLLHPSRLYATYQVPESVRQGNTVKAEQLNTERDNVLKAIESFKALLIS